MRLLPLLERIRRDQGFIDAARGPLRISVADVAKPAAVAALHAESPSATLFVTARPSDARRYADELRVWSADPSSILHFPEPDGLPYEKMEPNPETAAERLGVLTRLAGVATPALVVCCVRALVEPLPPVERFRAQLHTVRSGDHVPPGVLLQRWIDLGYEPSPLVDAPGQMARRGGIVDVFPTRAPGPGAVPAPYRIEFFGDEIDSIRLFDPETQRSLGHVEAFQLAPAREDLWKDAGSSALFEYLPQGAQVILDEPAQLDEVGLELQRQADELRAELIRKDQLAPGAPSPYFTWTESLETLTRERWRELEHDPDREAFETRHPTVYGGRLKSFLDDLVEAKERGDSLWVVVSQQTARLLELLGERGLVVPHVEDLATADLTEERVVLVHGSLAEGFVAPSLGFTLVSDNEIFGWSKPRRIVRRRRAAVRAAFLSDLALGDWVVHVDHGIGRFAGLVRNTVNGSEREFMMLEYAAGDRLYVPVDQADRVTPYVGAGDYSPEPTRLGSGEWTRAKQRVRRAVRDIARELLALYAARQSAEGFAYPPDTAWQAEMEAAFPFVETLDQLQAAADVKGDMQSQRPMDRLLVGDVGYGKTEVAVRAAFKAVENGRQVAVLVPTTVLAQQHFNTFRERLGAFPVRVEQLSRFLNEREQRTVLEGLRDGSVDVCIGTHRLVQQDVAFKNLGLVVIDEEQRFGVVHKERLKQLRKEVDVLTMTATPIPRTLHMSLVGVRDMSTIETPPEERLPIRTYVARFDEGLIREAILRELDRGGQVYFVHNRVQGIEHVASRLTSLVPEARIGIAHGQLHEDQLENAMTRFAAGEFDVLVCTTIIESGLDIPNVNTIVVNNAHRLGLSQLYQLRGRVGRGAARAYAYLLISPETTLSEEADKRLRTIFEATELGAGFRIAMKDLEIRGAGNLLGAEQHGHISAVGFELYTKLLGEAVRQIKAAHDGKPIPAADEDAAVTSVDLPLSAFLPHGYVQDEAARLNVYQRLAALANPAELGGLVEELEDRFGAMPEELQNLVFVVSLRLRAARSGIREVAVSNGEVVVRFRQDLPPGARTAAAGLGVPVTIASNQLRFRRGEGSGYLRALDSLVDALQLSDPLAGRTSA